MVPHHPRREIHLIVRDNGTVSEGWSDSGDQSVDKCHCRERMWRRLGGTRLSSEARCRKAPAKWCGWADKAIKSSLPPTEIILHVQGQEKSGGPRIDGHTEIGSRPQGYEIWLLFSLSQSRGSDKATTDPERILWPRPLRRWRPASGQVLEKRNLVERSPRRDPCNTGEDLRAVDTPKHRAMNWSTTATNRNHKKCPRILKSGYRRHATLRLTDARKAPSLRNRNTQATGTMMNGDCRTNSFRWERPIMGHQSTAICSTRKRWLDKPGPGSRMISEAARDNTSQNTWHKARDRGDPAPMSETISGCKRWEEGNPWRGCGICPSGRTTPRIRLQEPASVRKCRQAKPTCNRGRFLPRGL